MISFHSAFFLQPLITVSWLPNSKHVSANESSRQSGYLVSDLQTPWAHRFTILLGVNVCRTCSHSNGCYDVWLDNGRFGGGYGERGHSLSPRQQLPISCIIETECSDVTSCACAFHVNILSDTFYLYQDQSYLSEGWLTGDHSLSTENLITVLLCYCIDYHFFNTDNTVCFYISVLNREVFFINKL